MRDNYLLKAGDVPIRNKSAFGIIDHFGLYIGNGNVIDNHPERGVRVVSLESFLNGRELDRIVRFKGNSYERSQVVRRANFMIGQDYHLTKFNCEHFVNAAWGTEIKSNQVAAAGTLILFSAAIWGLSKLR
ncbi:MAG: lecithin retinol acyltransferase family protein [Reichenbachiella sp.]|uniref:lecithin retinol acyltransferase family protein n=1 Tax=Reichenbachiella sp. TaxID=2184521 RepID=UPI002966E72D|nr:lecithin retinol acyltransferase family protein [Reichenbachiella sp.]MDW3212174.1 lecithin retinol acyltransferase family protein [Reichenbachiella sp.]